MSNSCTPTSSSDTKVANAWCITRAKEIKILYKWTIDNFSLIYMKMGEEYFSSTFYSDDNDKLKWNLRINPNDGEYKDHISLFLELLSCNELTVSTSFKFSLLNAKGEKNNIHKTTYAFKKGMYYGWNKFIKRDLLLDESNGLLPENKLTILCEITSVYDIFNVSDQSSSMKLKFFDSKLSDGFGKLFDNEKLSDVTLVVCDHEFKVHKVILAARSDVFAAMFEHDLEETKLNRVTITDVGHEALREMLRFIYTDEVQNLDKIAPDLLVAADKYALEKLKVICEEALIADLSIETAIEKLVLADRHGADHLKSRTKSFICTHVNDVMETQYWKNCMVFFDDSQGAMK